MRSGVAAPLISALFGLLLSLPTLAAPAAEVVSTSRGARLLVRGRLVAILRTPNAGLSPAQRAEKAASRLRELIGDGLGGAEVEARKKGDAWAVYARDGLIMIATPAEAKERNDQPEETARRWVANLRQALGSDRAGEPKSAARKEAGPAVQKLSAAVPVGETRTFQVTGVIGELEVRVESPDAPGQEIAAASVIPGGVAVRGVAPGRAIVRVGSGARETGFTVWVKAYAGRVARLPVARVTGVSVPATLVRKAAAERLLEALDWERGATVRVDGPPTGLRNVPAGETADLAFPVTIYGAGLLTLKTHAKVQVRNQPVSSEPATALLYSNDPESIREYGPLYEAVVEPNGPVRMLYHHQNRMGRALTFQVYLLNPNAEAVDVQVVGQGAGPFIDPLQVGHRATQQYLSLAPAEIGVVGSVPPRGARSVAVTHLPHLQTVSGLFHFRIFGDLPLVVQVSASSHPSVPVVRDDLLETAREEPHVYPSPQKDERYDYTVGGHWTFVQIGQKAITGRRPNRKLFGNYGVLYNITVEMKNPTPAERVVRVMFQPGANWARGAFRIEGKLIEAPQLAPPQEAELWSARLGPGQTRSLSIQGIPAGGSAYPVSLVVRS